MTVYFGISCLSLNMMTVLRKPVTSKNFKSSVPLWSWVLGSWGRKIQSLRPAWATQHNCLKIKTRKNWGFSWVVDGLPSIHKVPGSMLLITKWIKTLCYGWVQGGHRDTASFPCTNGTRLTHWCQGLILTSYIDLYVQQKYKIIISMLYCNSNTTHSKATSKTTLGYGGRGVAYP